MHMENKIKELKRNREAIIIAEIGALLHDLGKCSQKFLRRHLKIASEEERKYKHQDIIKYDKEFLLKAGLQEFFERPMLNYIDPSSHLSERVIRNWGIGDISIEDIIKKHERYSPKRNEKLLAFVQIADRKDSADDRFMPIATQEKETFISTVFGVERKIEGKKIDICRKEFYYKLSTLLNSSRDFQEIRKEIFKEWQSIAVHTIAETRRAANDVTLWDHSYMTASIMKTLLAHDILSDFSLEVLERGEVKKHFSFKLRILGIGWNIQNFIGESNDLVGITGREKIIENVKSSLKNLLEFEIPLGNCVYEDENHLCFLVPKNIDNIMEDIEKEIFFRVTDISNHSVIPIIELGEASAYPSIMIPKIIAKLENLTKIPIVMENGLNNILVNFGWNSSIKEVCVECKKRPRMNDREICDYCYSLKVIGIGKLKEEMQISTDKFIETL